MRDVAIQVENLSKKYQIGRAQERHDTLRDSISAGIQSGLHRFGRNGRGAVKDDTIWALKDVSFGVRRGEVIGIIGRNGAGKSTLLKILSRITEPTSGRAVLNGRVGSLLEVGTGFHLELTGRENIYLNGAILGMRRAEIERKFDEIVAFSEIEKFLDTPVKRYSSGMYVRLAFAVAAHLEPEILLIDEVLAVGDIAFQQKCLGKVGTIAREGRTVLFVSHNLAAVANICNRAILLQKGVLAINGEVKSVIEAYTKTALNKEFDDVFTVNEGPMEMARKSNPSISIRSIQLLDQEKRPLEDFGTGDELVVSISYTAHKKIIAPAFMVSIFDENFVEVVRLSTTPISGYFIHEIEGSGTIYLQIKDLPLTGGVYSLGIGVARANIEWLLKVDNLVSFRIKPRDVYRSGMDLNRQVGLLALDHSWSLERQEFAGP